MKKFHNHILDQFIVFIFILVLSPSISAQNNKPLSYLEQKLVDAGMVDVSRMDTSLVIDLRYATTNNFTNKVLYDSLTTPYLHPIAANKLIKAHQILKQNNPEYRLLILDCARPLTVQRQMYEVVQNTPYSAYVANPKRTGLHNYGMAVDLTICDKSGKEIDMGTKFDFFGSAAGINKEDELIERGILTRQQVQNRRLLRKIMVDAGFLTIRGEWWHFNAVSLTTAKRDYPVL